MATRPDLSDDQVAELLPLYKVIAEVLLTTPVRLGTSDLADALTVKVAAYMGPEVAGLPEQLAELGRLRAALQRISQFCTCGAGTDCAASIAKTALDPEAHHG